MTTFADRPLEEQIAQWRAYLRSRRAVHSPDVEELEGHLRDQLVALTEAGLAGDEAFLVAVKRMGSLDALSRERGQRLGPFGVGAQYARLDAGGGVAVPIAAEIDIGAGFGGHDVRHLPFDDLVSVAQAQQLARA